MALSKDTLKNLLDVIQKLSLAITAVSIGLLSTIALLRENAEARAQPELDQLLKIRDEIGTDNAIKIINKAIAKAHYNFQAEAPLTIGLKIPHDPPITIILAALYPEVLVNVDETTIQKKPFKEIQTLDEMAQVWNKVVSTTKFRELTGRFELVQLKSSPLKNVFVPDIVPESQSERFAAARTIPFFEPRTVEQYGEGRVVLSYEYPELIDEVGRDTLAQAFRIEPSLLKSIQLEVIMDTQDKNFSPADVFGSELKKKSDFAEAFPDLDALPDNYRKQRLASLHTLLEEATRQSKTDLEVFGVKIPSDLITRLGLPFLFVLLFQFAAICCYSARHVERLEEEEASQWSFLLDGSPFFLLSFGTIFCLPVAAAILSLWKLLSARGGFWSANPFDVVLSFIVSVCAAVAFGWLWLLRSRVLRNPYVKRKRQFWMRR